MDLKKKLDQAKNKIKENRVATDIAIITACVASGVYALYVAKRIDEIREDVKEADSVIRSINDAAKHVRETGHPVTMYNRLDEPIFVMNAPEV